MRRHYSHRPLQVDAAEDSGGGKQAAPEGSSAPAMHPALAAANRGQSQSIAGTGTKVDAGAAEATAAREAEQLRMEGNDHFNRGAWGDAVRSLLLN